MNGRPPPRRRSSGGQSRGGQSREGQPRGRPPSGGQSSRGGRKRPAGGSGSGRQNPRRRSTNRQSFEGQKADRQRTDRQGTGRQGAAGNESRSGSERGGQRREGHNRDSHAGSRREGSSREDNRRGDRRGDRRGGNRRGDRRSGGDNRRRDNRRGDNYSPDRQPNRRPNRQRRSPHPGAAPRGPDDLGGTQIEGRQAVREALIAQRRKVTEIFLSPLGGSMDSSDGLAEIADLAASQRVRYQEVSQPRLESMARTEAPQGVVAQADPLPPTPLEELAKPLDGKPPLLIAADGITDPGNLGAILRTAEVTGATGVVLTRHRAVRLTPTAVKAAAGAVEYLRIALVGGLPAALAKLSQDGLWVLGLDADAPQDITTASLQSDPLVLVVGSEGKGLSPLVRQRCDLLASIARHGRIDSLNVSAATAVALYEVLRSRQ